MCGGGGEKGEDMGNGDFLGCNLESAWMFPWYSLVVHNNIVVNNCN